MPILLAFLLIPMIEIALFIVVGGWLSLWPTLGLVVLGGVAGLLLVRRQGLATMADLQMSVQGRGDPARPLAHGAFILLTGLLLMLPGFFTDFLGLLLLIPPVRALLLRRLAARVVVSTRTQGAGFGAGPGARWPDASRDVIDGEATEVDPDRTRLR